jgi:hypothetical protein
MRSWLFIFFAVSVAAQVTYPTVAEISSDGKWTAALGPRGTSSAQVWAVDTATQQVVWKSPVPAVCFRFGPVDELFAISNEGRFIVYDRATGNVRRSAELRRAIDVCAINSDGTMAAVRGSGGRIALLEAGTARTIRELERPSTGVFALAFSPDGLWLATGEFNRLARLWNVATGVEQEIYSGHLAWVGALRFSANSRCLLTSSYEGFKLWEATTGRLLTTILHPPEFRGPPVPVNYSRNGLVFTLGWSSDATLRVAQHGSAECPGSTQSPASSALRLIVIGISSYQDARRSLFGARSDAAAIARLFEEQGESIYRHVPVVKLFDRLASRASIETALRQLAADAAPNDVAAIFFAGHGVDTGKEFYLLPYDVGESNSPEVLQRSAISAAELARYLRAVRARRKLIIIDACQSGGALTRLSAALSGSGDSIHLLASSLDNAMEARRLGHGIMTFALLQTLGKETFTVSELFRALNISVPEIARKYFPAREQLVATHRSGDDFQLLPRR